jgi:hypothetical protein
MRPNNAQELPRPLQRPPNSRRGLARHSRRPLMARRVYKSVHRGKGPGVGEGESTDAAGVVEGYAAVNVKKSSTSVTKLQIPSDVSMK